MDAYIPLLENNIYHIYNRGNNRENIFYKPANYHYFLKKYDHYLRDYVDTFAYCFLPNHFHLLARVKPFSQFPITKKTGRWAEDEYRVSDQLRLLFMSYAKAVNIQEDRVGSLFQKNFKRIHVDNPKYFSNLVHYIHANPQIHGICEDFREYQYSSFGRILTDKPSKLFKHEVLSWFGNKEEYVRLHTTKTSYKDIESYLMEGD